MDSSQSIKFCDVNFDKMKKDFLKDEDTLFKQMEDTLNKAQQAAEPKPEPK